MHLHAIGIRHLVVIDVSDRTPRPLIRDWWTACHRIARRVGHRAHQAFCGIGGHDLMMHFEPTRLRLECATCGYQTPGWIIGSLTAVPSGKTPHRRGFFDNERVPMAR
jgi:hypothetical protein